MSFAHAILGGALVLSFSILLASFNAAESQQPRPAGYMIASGGNSSSFVWRVNTSTGGVSYCVRLNGSTSEDFVARQSPFCSAESKVNR